MRMFSSVTTSIVNTHHVSILYNILFQAFLFYHYIWISPIHLLVVTCLLYIEIGVPSILAAVLIILQIPVQIISAKLYSVLR